MQTYQPASEQRPGETVVLLREEAGSQVQRTVLPGGLRIISEQVPSARSVSVGAWVAAGSRDEESAEHGAAHYLEHLLFKATQNRSAMEVAAAIDAVGGDLNAFTSREFTCYYARVLDRDLPLAVDVVLDVVGAPLMRDTDVEGERGVVLEEIAMHEDDPGDVAHEHLFAAVLSSESLARPVLGTSDSIRGLSGDRIRGFYERHYVAPKMVIAAAGAVDHGELVELVSAAARQYGWLDGDESPQPVRSGSIREGNGSGRVVLPRHSEQIHLVVGGPGLTRRDDRRYAFGVMNSILGQGMSSRLFQQVREERGLAYSVYSFAAPFADAGVFGVYAGSSPEKSDEAAEVIAAELAVVAERGLTPEEVDRGRGHLRGSLVLGLEDGFARMARLGKAEVATGELPGIAEIHRRLDDVSPESVAAVASDVLGSADMTVVVGPEEGESDG